MSYFELREESWDSVCDRVASVKGEVSWRWAALRETDESWKLASLVVSVDPALSEPRVLRYQRLVLGCERLSGEVAAQRLRAGLAIDDQVLKRLVFPLPASALYPKHRGTGDAGPYRSRSGWPEFEVQYDSERATSGQQIGNVGQLVERDLPVYPSGTDAVAHFVFETAADDMGDRGRVGTVLIRIPDRRARIAALRLERGRVATQLDGVLAGTVLRLALRRTNADAQWTWRDWTSPPSSVRWPVLGVPYEAAVYLATANGHVIDHRGWKGSYGDRPTIGDWEPTRVVERIRGGEDETTEFKELIDKDKTFASIARTVAAFANGNGGVIFIGVSDDGEVKGADAKVRAAVDDAIRHRVSPPDVPYRWRALRIKRVPIQALVIAAAGPTIYKADKVVWIRLQATTREANSDEIRGLVAGSGALRGPEF